ncbi:hypothetical protein GIB67_017750, partial [Kingdonia uniflora]
FKISHYGRLLICLIRPVIETYNIVIQIYTLSEGCLLSQSIRSGRDALYNYSIFKISHYGRLLLQHSYSIYTFSEDRLLSQSIQSGRDALYSYSIFKISYYNRLLIRSIRPVTENYNIALPVYTLSRG